MTQTALQYKEAFTKTEAPQLREVKTEKTLPPALSFIDRPPVFVVDSDEFSKFLPPLCPILPISGFVDDKGCVHFEINTGEFVPEKPSLLKRFTQPAIFYKNLPERLVNSS